MGDVTTGKALAVNAPGPRRPYLRTKNVFDGRIDIDDVLTMPMTDAEFERFLVVPGDVLLNEGQSLELVGRCALYRGEYTKPCAMQNQLLRFRARPGVSAGFAAHLFRYSQQQGVFARIALQTTSIAHLGATRLEGLELAWPEREAEQRAIAAVLSDVDELIGSLESLVAKKRAIKQAAMQGLLTGRATLPGFGGKWTTKRINDVAVVTMGQSPPSASYNEVGDGLPLIQGKADIAGRTTINRVWTTHPSKLCDEGDLVLTVRAPVGAIARASKSACLGRGVCGLKPLVDRVFLFYALVLRESRWEDVEQGSTFTAANSAQVAEFRIDVPRDPLEQHAIGAVLSDIDDEIAALKRQLAKTRAMKQGMMQELLTGKVRLPLPPPEQPAGGEAPDA